KYGAVVDTLPRPVTRQNTEFQLPGSLMSGLFSANQAGETFSIPGISAQMIVLQVDSIDRPESETLDLLAQASALDIQAGISEDLFRAYLMSIAEDVELNTNGSAFEAYKRSLVTEQ
ncbi:MAG: hypothetical protein AAGA89_15715, partial [Pseudomonadota bacterium]